MKAKEESNSITCICLYEIMISHLVINQFACNSICCLLFVGFLHF